jgi:hypothetical protein
LFNGCEKKHLPEKDTLNAAKNKKAARRWTAYKLPRSGLVQHLVVIIYVLFFEGLGVHSFLCSDAQFFRQFIKELSEFLRNR